MMLKNLFKQLGIIIPVFLFLVVQYRLWFDDTGVVSSKVLAQKIEQIQMENDFHQSENNKLLAEVTELRQGTDLLEERAREELGLIRQGESFILFADPETP